MLKGGDSDWFQQFGFKNVGGGAELSIERKLTFGHGIPTWSPYFNAPRDEAWVSTRKGTLRNTSTLHPIGGYERSRALRLARAREPNAGAARG